MNKTILYLGLNDKMTKKQEVSTEEAIRIINILLLDDYELLGATLQLGNGIYKHDDGSIITEKTIIIILLGVEDIKVNAIIKDLKLMFNQETILKETSQVNYSFI